jgi:FkbM family methyltransferase
MVLLRNPSRGIIAAGAALARRLAQGDERARLMGFARSLAMYYGRPWRTRRMRARYRDFLGPGDLAFDVGAHVGDRARCWSRLGAQVVAIEPQPRLAAWLRRLFRSDPRVIVIEAAVGAAPGTLPLLISRRTPTVTTLSKGWIESVTRTPGFAWVVWDEQAQVAVTTLDALIARHGRPRFVKIDVEGFEAEVLRGLSQPLAALSLEVVPAAPEPALAALDLLAGLGDYRFNLTLGERHDLLWPQWRPAAAVRAWLAALRPDDPSGDIYARLDP